MPSYLKSDESAGAGISQVAAALAEVINQKSMAYKSVSVENGKTGKIILPEGMGPDEAREWLKRFQEQQIAEVSVNVTIDAFPLDGAINLARVLSEKFGWQRLVPTPGFFGPSPPAVIDIEVGPGQHEQVHWGSFALPGIDGRLETSYTYNGKRCIFRIGGKVQRRHEGMVKELGDLVRQKIATSSIYRGQAIRVNYRDEEGNSKDFSPADCPSFIVTKEIREEELVFPESTQTLVDTALFTPIEYSESCRKVEGSLKRGILLEGPFGVGKTLTARVLAKKCVDHGWTFIYLQDVRDLDAGLSLAQQYQPAVIFAEDVDRAIAQNRDSEMDKILNTLDGIHTKGTEIITVLTTNSVESINQAMIRPGRIDTVIPVRVPDLHAAIRLVRLYGRNLVHGTDEHIGKAIEPILGNNAAVFRECVERAKLAAVRRIKGKVETLRIEPADLSIASETMKHHIELLKPRVDTKEGAMSAFGRAVGFEVSKALISDRDTPVSKPVAVKSN